MCPAMRRVQVSTLLRSENMFRRSSRIISVICLTLVSVSQIYSQEQSESSINKLRQHLLTGYDVHARPVHHHSNTTMVSVAFLPTHITQLNENKGILTLEVWVYLGWQDDHLKWNQKDFSELDNLVLPDTQIWKPDISVMEGRGNKIGPWNPVNLEISNEGYVTWFPSATLEVVCGDFDYSQYPSDIQTCTVSLGSWAHDTRGIDMKLVKVHDEEVSLIEYNPFNPHWKLIGGSGHREEKVYGEHDPAPWVWIEYRLQLQRQNVPFSSLYSTPDAVARILILCMFWLISPTAKFLFGCTSLILLTSIAIGITVTLPSPAAAPAALYQATVSLALCVSALIIEIVVSSLSGFSLSLPSWFDLLAGNRYIRYLTPCNMHPIIHNKSSDKNEIIEDVAENRKLQNWPLLATLIDRVAFLVFAVLSLIL